MDATKQPLSKSRFLAGRQCWLRLWQQCFAPDLATEPGRIQQAVFETGHEVGVLATQRHPGGVLVKALYDEHETAMVETAGVLTNMDVPAVFEAAFEHHGVRIRADILLRDGRAWDLIEVKSSTRVKEVNRWDVALQYWVLVGAGIEVRRAGVLTLNADYVRAQSGLDVDALFTLHDLTQHCVDAVKEIAAQVHHLHKVVGAPRPKVDVGSHCFSPYVCEFNEACRRGRDEVEHPLTDLPALRGRRRAELEELGVESVTDIPEDVALTELQARVRKAALDGRAFVSDRLGAELKDIERPVHHLDFETVMPAIPRYSNTRPYQPLPFQWSNHIETPDGNLRHEGYLCGDDVDPREEFAKTLLASLGERGTICIYSGFEIHILRALADHLPELREPLLALIPRTWDIMAIIKRNYYHPGFHGSFSLKSVLPALLPDMTYEEFEVQDGQAASLTYLETLTTFDPKQKKALQDALWRYCAQDTLAMVHLRAFLAQQA